MSNIAVTANPSFEAFSTKHSTVKLDAGVNEAALKFNNKLGFVPKKVANYSTELFWAGGFMSATFMALRAFLMELFPKAFIGGAIRSKALDDGSGQNPSSDDDSGPPNLVNILGSLVNGKARFNWPVAADECFLELSEYVAMYFMPTLASTGLFARMIGKNLGIDFEFLGRPMRTYQEHFGKTVELGTLSSKKLLINKANLGKLAFGKFLLFSSIMAFCGSLEFMVPSIRNFLTKQFFGYDNFSKLLGFKQELKEDVCEHPLQHSTENVQKGLLAMLATIFGAFAFSKLAAGKIGSSPRFNNVFNRLSKHLDLGEKFALSNTGLALILTVFAIPGYLDACRGSDEKKEVFNRIVLYVIPLIVAYKQVVLNILTMLNATVQGLGGGFLKLFPVMKKQVAEGKRDPLDWNALGDLHYDKQTKEFSGLLSKMPSLEKLTPKRREAFLHQARFINKLPLILAPLIGMWINLVNLQIIYEMHAKENISRKRHKKAELGLSIELLSLFN